MTHIDVRTKAILFCHEIDDSDFPEPVIKSLPEIPFKIPEEEYKKRRQGINNTFRTIKKSGHFEKYD